MAIGLDCNTWLLFTVIFGQWFLYITGIIPITYLLTSVGQMSLIRLGENHSLRLYYGGGENNSVVQGHGSHLNK